MSYHIPYWTIMYIRTKLCIVKLGTVMNDKKTVFGTEDRGFESSQGVCKVLGLCNTLIRIAIVCI
jgi:hypothetical protein